LPATFPVQLSNQTGLDPTQYSIYALGYSTASKMELLPNGKFAPFTSASGNIPSYKVGSGPGELSTITLDQDQQLTGAIVFFFIVPLPVTQAPYLTYANSGADVVQPTDPPNDVLPGGQCSYVYQFVEFTQPQGGLPTIDVSEVDGFVMPVNVTLNGGYQVGQPLYQSSQTPAVNRQAIFTEYTNFISQISDQSLEQAYADGSWGRYHGSHCRTLCERLAAMHQVEFVSLCCSGTFAVELKK
jgi:hypothetical protein